MLIETGWPGFLAWLVGLVVMVRQIARWGRRDAMEAALLAGLAAVFAHNIVDFGFDTLGIRLPYVAVLGATLGRMVLSGERRRRSWVGMSLVAVAGLAVVIGGLGVARTPDYDRALRAASGGAARRAIALEAAAAHPADYFYPLHQGMNEPLAPDASGRSPRLRALGRALRLCDICWDPHRATARALWTIGRRLQAIGEWKRAAILSAAASGFPSVLEEVANAGATPAELVRFAPDEPALGLQVAWVLARKKARPELAELLDRLRAAGTRPIETWLVEVELATALGDRDGARRILRQAGLAVPGDARVPLGLADVEASAGNPALGREHAKAAVELDPANVTAQRKWFELSAATQSWPDAEKALEGLGMALGRAGLPMTEVRLGAGRMWRQRRHPLRAISELKTTTLIEPNNFSVWFELGQAAEEAGHVGMALDSYRQALRILPTDASTKAGLARLEDLKRAAAIDAIQNLGTVPGPP
jgi:tetratricopeptide (TPR) repeat protein